MSESEIEPPGDPEKRGQWLANVIRAIQPPATMLLWFGVGSMVLAALTIAVFLAAPDSFCERWHKDLVKEQFDRPPEEREPVPTYSDFVRAKQIQFVGSGAVSLPCSFLIAFGGLRMRQLHGFGWALTGSILSIVPFTNMCCCLGTPIGLWAIVVLFGSDVRLAFSRVGAAGGLEAFPVEPQERDEPPSRPIRLE